jgi:hypothetical protein
MAWSMKAILPASDPSGAALSASSEEIDQRRGDPGLGRGAGIAERGDRQRLRGKADQFGLVGAATIGAHGERLDRHLLEAQRLEPRGRPFAGARFGQAARRARADLRGQVAHQIPRDINGGRRRVGQGGDKRQNGSSGRKVGGQQAHRQIPEGVGGAPHLRALGGVDKFHNATVAL